MKYYVNKNARKNGDHEVHREGCSHLPKEENMVHLGDLSSCEEAMAEAKGKGYQADGCYYCSKECNKSRTEKTMTYYVNKQAQKNGDNEVHAEDCSYLPNLDNCDELGNFGSCQQAISEAGKLGYQADGCYWCCRECNNS